MCNTEIKFPRIHHVPLSKGLGRDDRRFGDITRFFNQPIIITEKLDGENTTLTRDKIFARSVDSGNHESRDWVKALHGRVAHLLDGYRIHGENVYAQHSLHYNNLGSYFYIFGVSTTKNNDYLSWEDVCVIAAYLDIPTTPVMYKGECPEVDIFNMSWLSNGSMFGDEKEGYVVRQAHAFKYNQADFSKYIAKYVRANHVTSDQHWMHKSVVKNGLRQQA